jgi:hypothetical protein
MSLIHSNQMSIDDIQIKSNQDILIKLFDFVNTVLHQSSNTPAFVR